MSINLPKFFKSDDPTPSPLVLPLLPLRDIVVFPHMVAPLFVGRKKSVNALADAMNQDKSVFLATQKNAGVDSPGEKDICAVGTIGKVLQLLRLPDGTVKGTGGRHVTGNGPAFFFKTRTFFRSRSTPLTRRN